MMQRGAQYALSVDEVKVGPAFAQVDDVLLARAAAVVRSPSGCEAMATLFFTGAAIGVDEQEVRARAFGELVERVSAHMAGYEAGRTLTRSIERLRQEGRQPIVEPSRLRQFSSDQVVGPFLDDIPEDVEISWCDGQQLKTRGHVLVPALACFLRWRPPCGEPVFIKPGASGLSAMTSWEAAVRHAVLEVLERDALMLSWRVPGWPTARLDLGIIPPSLFRVCDTLMLSIEAYCLGWPSLPPTVLVMLCGRDSEMLTCGSACGDLSPGLVARATHEALMMQWTMRYSPAAHKLLQESSSGSREPTTSLEHVVGSFANGMTVVSWYRSQSETLQQLGSRHWQHTTEVTDLVRRVEGDLECPVVVVDVTDQTSRNSGWYVVRAIVPDALPKESDHRIAHLGGRRLAAEAKRIRATDKIRTDPHPFG